MNSKQIKEQVLELFNKRSSLMTLRQEIAENFYPERADFTLRRQIGEDYAGSLTTSYPLLCRRDLGDQFGSMLRPVGKEWFHTVVKGANEKVMDGEARRWLESRTNIMRRAMYDNASHFKRAATQLDHDIAAFGDGVPSIELNRFGDTLLYRTWHTRDVVWQEDSDGHICLVGRKWRPGAAELVRLFKNNHAKAIEKARKKPFEEIEVLHIVVDAELYDDDANGKPRWSIYYDCENNHVIEGKAIFGRIYRPVRWQTVSGSQYAMSPAAIVALPEARLLQAMALTLLEAGEGMVNPPLLATIDAVKSDIQLYPGGITWLDNEYDEKTGEALRPLLRDVRGMPLSQELNADTRAIIKEAWYLNKLTLPRSEGDMTAFETAKRVEEYIRGALPLFEPLESDYNGQVCEETWDLMMRSGGFGSPFEMPRSLRGAPIDFKFESPLHEAIERQKAIRWVEAKQIVLDAATIDKSAIALLDAKKALRDVLQSLRTPQLWIRDEVEVKDIEEANAALEESAQALAALEQGSAAAANMGAANKANAEAEVAV